jgi:hypothetical protein
VRIGDLSTVSWRKSSYSNQDGGACIEVSGDFDAVVPARDSKTADGPVITFAAEGWTSFVTAVKRGTLGA